MASNRSDRVVNALFRTTMIIFILSLLGMVLPLEAATPSGQAQVLTESQQQTWPTLFGVGASFGNLRNSQNLFSWLPQMQEAGVGALRSVKASWPQLQPEPGRFVWQSFDQQLQGALNANMSVGILLFGNAPWNTLDPKGHLPVNNLEAWKTYVSEVTRRASGRAESGGSGVWMVHDDKKNQRPSANPSDDRRPKHRARYRRACHVPPGPRR